MDEIVKQNYNKIAEKYSKNRYNFNTHKLLLDFVRLLSKKSKILDVGCGPGIPIAKSLTEKGFDVTGIDFSGKMIELARINVPKAKFLKKDMLNMNFKEQFDGIVAFYSVIHVKREKHGKLFRKFYGLLKPKGIILVCMGSDEWIGTEEFYGEKMFWSQYPSDKSLELVKNVGFRIIFSKNKIIGGEKHFWILAQK